MPACSPAGTPAGFVIPREQPLLCAVDLPGYSASDPFGFTPLEDSDYDTGGWAGCSDRGRRAAASLSSNSGRCLPQFLA